MEKLLQEITNCENIQKCLIEKLDYHPCNTIIKSQERDYENFQLPEPWNGDLENCKILFISSNPSFNKDEYYPLGDWDKSIISDFFINRFRKIDGDKKIWVEDELYPLQSNDVYSDNWVRFWAAVRSIARVILDTKSTTAGKDYALTEIVHCKSKGEKGVHEAMETCVDKYLDRIIKITKAKIIICLGEKASNAVKNRYQIETTGKVFENPTVDKVFLFLPHPNAHVERRLNKILTQYELEKVKDKVK